VTTAILALDLWEHAYYLDHQNRRAAYVSTFLEELVNWDFANRTLANLAVNSDTRAVRVRHGGRDRPRSPERTLRRLRSLAPPAPCHPQRGADGRAAPR